MFNNYFQDLYELFTLVENMGGFEEVTSHGMWRTLDKNGVFTDVTTASNLKNLREFYEDYLFHFEKSCSKKLPKCDLENYEKNIEKMDPALLEETPIFVHGKDFNVHDDDTIQEVINCSKFLSFCLN